MSHTRPGCQNSGTEFALLLVPREVSQVAHLHSIVIVYPRHRSFLFLPFLSFFIIDHMPPEAPPLSHLTPQPCLYVHLVIV